MISANEYQNRRQTLMQQMQENSIAILCTKPEYPRANDCSYPFRADSNFYYLTGFTEPEAMAIFIPNRDEGEYILFNRPRDPDKEIWDGLRAGQEGAIANFRADQAFAYDEIDEILPDLLKDKTTIYYQFGHESGIDDDIITWEQQLKTLLRSGSNPPKSHVDLSLIINDMRSIKSVAELNVLRKAAAINVEAHKRAMQHCVAGITERQLCAELTYVHQQHNCLDFAYEPIVATGDNACILHYRAGTRELQNGELVLIDVGQEYQQYTSDITRTIPVNGKFSAEQASIYQLVLDVQQTMIDFIKPGIRFDELQKNTVRLITEGLITLGLLQGKPDALIEQKAYTEFYPHSLGHWLGLDVHDVCPYALDGQWRTLEAGMVLTVEPGIYIQANNQNVDAKWRGIGIRIEDDVVVTERGCEVLTSGAPKSIAEIEQLMNS